MKPAETKETTYAHILKYTSLFGGVQGLSILIGVVRNKCVALLLGPDGMGLVSLFNSTIRLMSDSTNFGIQMSGVRNISEAFESGDSERVDHAVRLVRFWSFLSAILGMVLCVVLSPLLNRWTFAWGDHTLHFVLLSPVVALTAITGGETAILKGTRQLRSLALIPILGVLGAFLISVPLYYFFGQAGIVPSLVLMALVTCLLTIAYSFRRYPLRTGASKAGLFREGSGMVRLGVAFVLAGIMGSGAEFAIRSFLNHTGDLVAVGLYNTGYMMTMTCAGLVFSAMETDYFPRLSAIPQTGAELNEAVNRQMEVSLLIVAPLFAAFTTFLPLLLPLLFSSKFLPVMGMMHFTILAMYLRAILLPIEYISLSRGHSRVFLAVETLYAVALVVCVVLGYEWKGLDGAGAGILSAMGINLLFDLSYFHHRYGYHLDRQVVKIILMQFSLGLLVFAARSFTEGLWAWTLSLAVTAVSVICSMLVLQRNTHLLNRLRDRIKDRLS
ncbi:MAG: oligosaccharide flippase family protein [Prevotella sp.]